MATFNATSSTNNANQVLWGWSTRLVLHSDRKASATVLRGSLIEAVENLGVGVSLGDPFTLLT